MKSVIKSILSVILSCCILISAFLTIAAAVAKFKLTNEEHYVKTIITDEYVDALHKDIYANVTIICENLEVHRDDVMSFVSKPELKRISQLNVRAVFSSLMSGTPLQYERFENEALKDMVYEVLEAFANEHGIEEDVSEATEVTYNYIMDDINATITYFTQDNLSSVSFVSRIPGLNFISNSAFFVALAVLVVLCVLKFLLLGKRRILSCAYNVSFMLWLASACWFIPVTVFKIPKIAMKIAIAHSGFRLYIQNLINMVIDGFFNVSLCAFIISSLAVIGSITSIVVFTVKSNRNQNTVELNQEN